ncbi:MAG: cardiolipin synthase [Gammaproteobacteria bacterium]
MTLHDFLGLLGFLLPLIHIAGILHAVHAVMYVRTAQGAIAWAVSLVTFPYVAIPLYWVFGRNKFQGYVELRRSGNRDVDELTREIREAVSEHRVTPPSSLERWYRPLVAMSGLPMTGGNHVRLLINGDQTFESMLKAIDEARDYVLVQFFIVHNDRIGKVFQSALMRKAEEGVPVYFIYDEVGSRKLSKRYLKALRDSHVAVTEFDSTRGRGNRLQINFRNHRKLLVVDGREAFVGGLNLGDEYLLRTERFGAWRDTHLAVRGPAVQHLQRSFVRDWYWAIRTIPTLRWEVEGGQGGTPVLVLASGPADPLETCELFFVNVINMARKRLWITSPYFVPDEAVVRALQLAALRGVDVRILLPDRPDHILVYLSAYSYYNEMHEAGVRLFRYEPGFMHQKVVLIDDHTAAVGTANLDNRSFRLNFETTVVVAESDFASQVAKMLEADFAAAREVHTDDYARRPLWFRAAVRIARLLAPIQ